MEEQSERDSIWKHIYHRMQEKETGELVAIWQKKDRAVWTDEALEVVQEILLERLGEMPEPVESEGEDDEESAAAVEYPGDKKLYWIADAANYLSWVILAVVIANIALKLLTTPLDFGRHRSLYSIILLAGQIETLIYAGFAFLVLQAINEVLYLLMDIREIAMPEELESEISS
jgi:hypothetical protein